MRRAEQTDKRQVVDILSRSFDTNKSVNYVVKQGVSRKERIQTLMEYSFNVCLSNGEVWMSDDGNACALLLFPDRKKTTVKSIAWDIDLALNAIGVARVSSVLKRESLIKQNHPPGPFTYLWFIGVDPKNQKQGVGSRLLKEVIDMNDKKNRPIYLETSVASNLSWYEKFGFETYKKIDLNYDLFLLRRHKVSESTPVSRNTVL